MLINIPTLHGRWVDLEPLAEAHREELRPAAEDARIWTHALSVATGDGFDRWFNDTLRERDADSRIPFAVRQLVDGKLVGSTSYLDIRLDHKRVEIGATWYHPSVWRTQVNPECKLLLLTYAFEQIGMNRVSLITDIRNERSQGAIAKLGAVREGVLRSHMITQEERIRDSVSFSIVAEEWPTVRLGLERRLTE
jgi:RimJ/RimL family protein N-acetyltransferase